MTDTATITTETAKTAEEKKTVELKEKFYGEKDAKRTRLTIGSIAWNEAIDRLIMTFLRSKCDMTEAQRLMTEMHYAQGKPLDKDGKPINTSTLETDKSIQKLSYKQAASNLPDVLEKIKEYAIANKIDGIVETKRQVIVTTTVDLEMAKTQSEKDPALAAIIAEIEYKESTTFNAPKLKIA